MVETYPWTSQHPEREILREGNLIVFDIFYFLLPEIYEQSSFFPLQVLRRCQIHLQDFSFGQARVVTMVGPFFLFFFFFFSFSRGVWLYNMEIRVVKYFVIAPSSPLLWFISTLHAGSSSRWDWSSHLGPVPHGLETFCAFSGRISSFRRNNFQRKRR